MKLTLEIEVLDGGTKTAEYIKSLTYVYIDKYTDDQKRQPGSVAVLRGWKIEGGQYEG